MPAEDPPPPHHSPSPSPPPPAPQALTPGPRAEALNKLYATTLDHTLKAISYDSFSACFPHIAEKAPEALRQMHGNLTEGLRRFGTAEFEEICKERGVVAGLNALEGIVADGRRRKAAAEGKGLNGEEEIRVPPHTLPPQPLMDAHLTPLYISQQSQMNAKLQTVQSQNASLIEGIRRQGEEIEKLLRVGEALVKDLEGAGSELVKAQGEVGIADEGRAAESVLGDVRR